VQRVEQAWTSHAANQSLVGGRSAQREAFSVFCLPVWALGLALVGLPKASFSGYHKYRYSRELPLPYGSQFPEPLSDQFSVFCVCALVMISSRVPFIVSL